MRLNKVKKVWGFELQRQFKKRYKIEEMDYRFRDFLDEICDEGLYVEDYPKNKARLRITFPLFIFFIGVLILLACFKWFFTGRFNYNKKDWVTKKMMAWDRYCRFGIFQSAVCKKE